MDHDRLIQLLPRLLNKGYDKIVTGESQVPEKSIGWCEEPVCSDQDSSRTQSDSAQSDTSSDQEDASEGSEHAKHQERVFPQPVDLDEIEKFLEDITKSKTPTRVERPSREMASILREVDELGRRTLSSSCVVGGGSRPPPSPRRPPEPRGPGVSLAPAVGAASEPTLLRDGDIKPRVRFPRSHQTATRDDAASPACAGKLSSSEPALGYTLQNLMSEEKRKYLNLTADMIMLKQNSLANEIRMKTQWEEHFRDLMAENSSLKLEIDKLRAQQPPIVSNHLGDRTRVKSLEQRVQEQDRLLDGFNAENARLYRELKQLRTERADLEAAVAELRRRRQLLEAQLQAAQRQPQEQQDHHQQQQRQLRRRELELEQRWQELQRAGDEVARLHDLVTSRQHLSCARCRGRAAAAAGAPGQAEHTGRPRMASSSCQTSAAGSPPQSPARSAARSPEHMAAAAAADLRSLRGALAESERRLEQQLQATAVREAELRRAADARLRAAETRLRRLQAGSPSRPSPELMAALRRLRAQLADKERALTQSRRQLEKSQRTVTGLQREREKLLVTIAARSPERRSRRGSPVAAGHRLDQTLLTELQTAIAAVEEENRLLKEQLDQERVGKEEELSRRESQISALTEEKAQLRARLGCLSSPGGSEQEAVLSARKDSLMLEMGSHMEAQEHVIVHLRETIRRFQEQTRLIAGLEQENRALRETVASLTRQPDIGRSQRSLDTVQESSRGRAKK